MIRNESVEKIREFNRYYTKILGLLDDDILNSDFSLTEARILFELADKKEVTANALSSELGIDKSYMSRMIKSFEKSGLIVKTPDDTDNRAMIITLTEKGNETIDELVMRSNRQIEQMIAHLSGEEVQRLESAMQTIALLLNKKTGEM